MTPFGRATSARARRVTFLYHELFNAAMKYVTVVVGVARVYCKVLNYLWNSFSFFYSKQFKKVLIFYKRKIFITLYRRVEVYRP